MCANYISVQRHIDRGRGIAANHLGQPFNVYRLSSLTAINYADPENLIASNVRLFRRVDTQIIDVESPAHRMGELVFEMIGNFIPYKIGDFFLQNDPVYGVDSTAVSGTSQFNGIMLAMHAPVKRTVGIRVERYVQIFRPNAAPDLSTPISYFSSGLDNAWPLILRNNTFSFSFNINEPAALIPAGFQTYERAIGRLFTELPNTTAKTRWMVYVPILPGVTIKEGDRIVVMDSAVPNTLPVATGSRYVVIHPFFQMTGTIGHYLVTEREISQNGT